jgi:hypothetical protein
MATYDFQGAKSEMDFMLKGLNQQIEGNNIYGVKVPLNHSCLIARGRNSLVFRLSESGLVGKGSFYDTVPAENDPDHKGYFMLAGYASGLMEGSLETTLVSLQEMGFDKKTGLFLPEMKEDGCKVNLWHQKRVHYTLMPDLRENGRYVLHDAVDFPFHSYEFGSQLHELYEESCREVLNSLKSGPHEIRCAGHGSEEDPEPAIRHMFLVQFNNKEGRLCIADLNHLAIKKRG